MIYPSISSKTPGPVSTETTTTTTRNKTKGVCTPTETLSLDNSECVTPFRDGGGPRERRDSASWDGRGEYLSEETIGLCVVRESVTVYRYYLSSRNLSYDP